jgi:putative SOS response-associated peptidase YedK
MCGRFVAASSPRLLAEHFAVDDVHVEETEPSYNVAPTDPILVVRQREARDGRLGRPGAQETELAESTRRGRRVLSRVRWGLIPSWSKDASSGYKMINARAESLSSKSAYKRAFEKHRCLIPADGFYEWKVIAPPSTPKGRPRKQPVFVHRRDGEPMAMAGLWASWKVPEGVEGLGEQDDGWLRSAVIITTRPNGLLEPIHDRMPALLPESAWASWLDPEQHDLDALSELLVPAPDDALELWPVGPLVNKPDNNGPELVTPVPDESVNT